MKRLMNMKETLMSCVEGQITHLDSVDTKELGEVIDMIKDLSEAVYYCTITEAMEGDKKEHYERDKGRMYYPYSNEGVAYYNGNISSSDGSSHSSHSGGSTYGDGDNNARGGGTRGYSEHELMMPMHDEREGRSSMSRKTYMEYKQTHQDKTMKLRELEKYMQELTTDMVEMIEGASPEEKQLLERRISALATKIGQTSG